MECGSGHHDIGYRRKTYRRREIKSTKSASIGKKKERNCKEEKKMELNSHCMQSLLINKVYF